MGTNGWFDRVMEWIVFCRYELINPKRTPIATRQIAINVTMDSSGHKVSGQLLFVVVVVVAAAAAAAAAECVVDVAVVGGGDELERAVGFDNPINELIPLAELAVVQ